MEDWQRRVIQINLPKLIRDTDCNKTLVAILFAKELISEEERVKIGVIPSPFDKADFLYKIIVTRKNGYEELLEASREVKQSGISHILEIGEKNQRLLECLFECNIADFACKSANKVTLSGFLGISKAIGEYVDVEKFELAFQREPLLLRGPKNETYLHVAAEYGYVKLIDFLIEKGLPISTVDDEGRTPGHYIGKFSTNIIKTLKTLKQHGSDLRQTNDYGWSILSTVILHGKINQYHYHHLVDYIIKMEHEDVFTQKCKEGATPLHHALQMLDLEKETIDLFLKSTKLNINLADNLGRTPLHWALMHGRSLTTIKVLIELRADYKMKDDKKEGALHFAVRGSKKEIICFLISLKMGINEVDRLGETPLHKARFTKSCDYFGMTKFLLDIGANLSAKDKNRNNVAHLFALTESISSDEFHVWAKGMINIGQGQIFAAQGQHKRTSLQTAMEKLNLERNAIQTILNSSEVDINQPDDNGNTLLLLALEFGRSLETIKSLISLGANIKAKNKNGNGVLHCAVVGGKKEIISFLVSLKADINEVDYLGETPIHKVRFTESRDFFGMTIFLLDIGANLSAKDKNGNNVAHLLASAENISSDDFQRWAKEMINIGQSHIFAALRQDGRTPLQTAIQRLDLEKNTMKMILESSKVDINKPDKYGSTILLLALQFGRSLETIKSLISLGADIKINKKGGSGALHLAVVGGQKEVIQYLISQGLNINEKNNYEDTPLRFVSQTKSKNYVELTKLLLENGADLYSKNKIDNTLAHGMALLEDVSCEDFKIWVTAMIENGHAQLFTIRGNRDRTPLHCSMERHDLDLETIKLMIESAKLDINQPDKYGNTVLHEALKSGRSLDTIKSLVELGADWKKKGWCGRSVLHCAVMGSNKEAFLYFKSLGADVNTKDIGGQTPLHYVRRTKNKDYLGMTKFLLENGADLNARGRFGHTLDQFMSSGYPVSAEEYVVWKEGMIKLGHSSLFQK